MEKISNEDACKTRLEKWLSPEIRLRKVEAELATTKEALAVLTDAIRANPTALSCWNPITYDAYGDGTPVERECGECQPCRIADAAASVQIGLSEQ